MRRIVPAFALAAALTAPALAQPPIPETDITFKPPTLEVNGYEQVDPATQSVDLARLRGEPVYSSITERRIGHVDDVYIDSASAITYLGLEVGGAFEIGDHEVVIPLDQVSLFRRIPHVPDLYGYEMQKVAPAEDDPTPAAAGTLRTPVLVDIDKETRALMDKFAYRFVQYRIYIAATKEEIRRYPEFDLY